MRAQLCRTLPTLTTYSQTANSFITTLSGYATFFGPLTGIMLVRLTLALF